MKILHGTWIPSAEDTFIQTGAFYIWAETTEGQRRRSKNQAIHPRQLPQAQFTEFLAQELGIKVPPPRKLEDLIAPQYFLLPSTNQEPLPSLELARYLESDLPEDFNWQYWQVDCCPAITFVKNGYSYQQVSNVIKLLNELHFLTLYNLAEDVQLGADLLFWYHYTQSFKSVIFKDQYIPALKYRELAPTSSKTTPKGKRSPKKSSPQHHSPAFEIYPAWEIISEHYETQIQQYTEAMPLVCTTGFSTLPTTPQFHNKEHLLRHFSECLLAEIVTHTPSTAAFDQQIADSLLYSCLHPNSSGLPWVSESGLKNYKQWQAWRDRITRTQSAAPFYLCFRLQEPAKPEDPWQVEFQVAARQDPSHRLPLADYWLLRSHRETEFLQQFGDNFEQHLLLNLGYAARIYTKLWTGLETDQPTGITLTLSEALEFLKESAWILEDAGYKVIIPAWWTPKGRQRAKVRLQAAGRKISANNKSKSYLSFDTLVEYQYELSIGGHPVSEQEWLQLVNAKVPLVQFRGQWMELDLDKMQQMLEFWKKHQQEHPEMSLLDVMKLTATEQDDLELDVVRDQALAEMLAKLNDKSQLEPVSDLPGFQGTLRGYQQRGVSWLHYLENLGLNGCLADDMGLGKSAQVIARLVQEREQVQQKTKSKPKTKSTVPPTLLIAPTSVVGNWQKEIEKFAPQLTTLIHHGSQRVQDLKAFKDASQKTDVVITSFTLARKDEKFFTSVDWHRLVVDEAQNIKNPKAAQTKAICKLPAHHRLALTGTPVENRLLDLWSIFQFLNPGYLGKETQFRQSFEIPIQKNNDVQCSATLKKLVEPFILRRVKTDQSIIQDLPDKVEQKQYCNLTKEQAALYEAVVKNVETQLENTEEITGIKRKGLILATLLKLKQICNHPMQFLQDGSDFTPERSHKLERLHDMVAEAQAEGESLLIFTQFTEIGDALEKYLRHTLHCNTYYLHGGTSRNKREQMITEFQDPETEPSVFVLSLKAGGVGITLTKANHVFHFDRWWNPAVEDQATDRAFRIGQKKNVFVHKFVAIGTLEERIDQMIEDKKKLAGAIVGADESWLTELDNDAFKQLIALNQNAILD
jgi:SNF2 family DNA or RNA helicase